MGPNALSISLRDPLRFTILSNELHLKTAQTTERALQASAQRLSHPSAIARVSARARRVNRLARLWPPFDRRLMLSGVRTNGGEI
eukprot:3063137-Pyramimonas_sp.AAC.1